MRRSVFADTDRMQAIPLTKSEQPWDFSKPGWLYQIKYDGFGCLLYKDKGRCFLESKESKDLTAMRREFESLCKRVAAGIKAKQVLLDGEIVVLGPDHKPDFWALMGRKGTPVYAAYDLLMIDGRDLRALPLKERLALLRKALPRASSDVLMVDTVGPHEAADIFAAACAADIEGLVAKRADSPYNPRLKGMRWRKILNPRYSLATGKREYFERLLLGKARRAKQST
jgi:bifunctional non-homologous end joining protein LigD